MNLLNPIYTLLLYMLYESQILNHFTSNPDEDIHTISEFSHVRALLLLLEVQNYDSWLPNHPTSNINSQLLNKLI